MGQQFQSGHVLPTGRIQEIPDALLHEEVLEPQFRYELQHLLHYYVLVEMALLLEQERLGHLKREVANSIGALLYQISPEVLTADPATNMSDIAFAIEQYVQQRLSEPAPLWHVDRSRNDYQACTQVMFGREQLLDIAARLLNFARVVYTVAAENVDMAMPGYTHYQAAQVITPGFYLSALIEHLLGTLRWLLAIYDDMNRCPLGAGAMAGLELQWDRERLAHLLGFAGSQRHALLAVASREWVLRLAGEFSAFGVVLSRFLTDLMCWGSSAYSFIDLPDALTGISSAMPQKKNFTILERIRGKSAHLSAFSVDFLLGQRNTPYTNLVEVSKEAGTYLLSLCADMRSMLRLCTVVVERIQFRRDRMRAACEVEYLGGFALANYLALHEGIPYRTAQTIAGRSIAQAIERQLQPGQIDSALLHSASQCSGYTLNLSDAVVQQMFSVEYNLHGKQSSGSTSPPSVTTVLTQQEEEIGALDAAWEQRRTHLAHAYRELTLLAHGDKRRTSL